MMASQVWAWLLDNAHMPSSTSIYLLASIFALCSYYLYVSYLKEPFSWEKYGVPHAPVQVSAYTDIREGYRKMLEKYGRTVGLYTRCPVLLTADRDLIKQIMVKDFSNFSDRFDLVQSNSLLSKSLFFAGGYHWRWKRQMMSPNFSTSKLKLIAKIINEKAKRLGACMADCAQRNRLAHVKQISGHFAAEVIAQSAFGCQIDCLESGEDDEFALYCQNLVKKRTKLQRLLLIPLINHRWLQVLLVEMLRIPFFDFVNGKANDYFRSLLRGVIDERLKDISQGKPVPMDFLQMFSKNSILSEQGKSEAGEKQIKLNDVMAEMVLIIFAGFETTSTTLQFVFHFLAIHQNIQDKVFQEIQDKIHGDTPTPEEVSKLTYTKQVIDETLRLYPPLSMVDRTAREERKYGDITIPAKARVTIPIFFIHRDPKLYPNPEVFDPERFSEEQVAQREPFSFIPFGGGPRLCLGMRLAYLQMKLAVVYVLRKVKVTVNDKTCPPAGESIKLSAQGFTAPDQPIMLALELR